MRPLPQLADPLRDEASTLLHTDGRGHLRLPRYLDVHSPQGSTNKLSSTVGVNPTTSDQIESEPGEVELSSWNRTLGAHDTTYLDDDANVGGVALPMPDISSPSSSSVEPWRGNSAQEHAHSHTDSEHDDDDDDLDVHSGAPLYDVPMTAEAGDGVSASSSVAIYSSLDEEDDEEDHDYGYGYDYGSDSGSSSRSGSDPDSESESQSGSDQGSAMDTFDDYLNSLLLQTHTDQIGMGLADDSASELSTEELESPDMPPLGTPQPQTQALLETPPENPGPMPDLDHAFVSIMNPFIPASYNHGLVDFLLEWARLGGEKSTSRKLLPDPLSVTRQANEQPAEITYDDLKGEECDFQGLNWRDMKITRRQARARRRLTYINTVNHPGSDRRPLRSDNEYISSRDNFFRFIKNRVVRDAYVGHYQLRNALACPTAFKSYYPSHKGVMCVNSASGKTGLAMDMWAVPGLASAITALDANHGVLLAGTFAGDYLLQSLHAENSKTFSDGQGGNVKGIVNHIKIGLTRSGSGPIACISNNEKHFQVMDIGTERILSSVFLPFAPNCTALSPDRRLRIVVGDYSSSLLIDATTGEVLCQIGGHRDYGFACDWSDDGRTFATGFQDKRIMIWDARRWCDSRGVSTPLQVIRTNMGSARSLRFSPLGSGKNVLAAAEDADFVHIIDGQLYRSKQTFDIFGEIGGISFANDGQNLNVLCADRDRGGLLQFERCGHAPEPLLEDGRSHDDDEDMDDEEANGEINSKYDGWRPAYSQQQRHLLARAPPTLGGLEPF